jgi:hypothetical protein
VLADSGPARRSSTRGATLTLIPIVARDTFPIAPPIVPASPGAASKSKDATAASAGDFRPLERPPALAPGCDCR